MQFVKGPDFPTGGYILGRQGIMDAYRTGRGSIKMRAKAEIVETKRGGTAIVVTELPYQVSPRSVLDPDQGTGRRPGARRHPGRQRRLGQGPDTGIVIELKRDANANVVLNNLYKHTPLQTSFGVNMVALVDGVPRTLNLVQALPAYVDHQVEVIRRRSEFRLKKARDRAHIVEGLIKALDMIDAIIAAIRASEDRPGGHRHPAGGAVRVQRRPGHAHPGHAAVAADPPGPGQPGGGAGRAAPDHRRARGHPGRRGRAARGHQDRDGRDPRRVRQRPPGR